MRTMPVSTPNVWLRRIYMLAMVPVVFTGFGAMPIYRRYYVNEVPGLGWTANFYSSLQVHYVFAALAVAIAAFIAVDYLLLGRRWQRLTVTGRIRAVLLAGTFITGGLMALRNTLPVRYSFDLGVVFTLGHMTLAMFFLFFSLGCLIARAKWTLPAANPGR